MGDVYVGEQISIQTRVAIKVLHREISVDTQQVERFFNEARIVSRIKHAGVVKIFDVGFHAGRAYLVMEMLEGESLASRIARNGRIASHDLAEVCRQIASTLAATHAAGVIHRDLKPDNVFLITDHDLGNRERVKLLDFGIAKLNGTLAAGPKTFGTMGTPAYMAPEQWGNSANVDWRADAYSLGCVAFEMATGQTPFVTHSLSDACAAHLHAIPPRLQSLLPTAPNALDQLIEQLLAKNPAARGSSMMDITQAFERCGSTETKPAWDATTIGRPPGDPAIARGGARTTLGGSAGERTEPARQRKPIWAVLAVLGVGALIAGGLVIARQAKEPETAQPTPAASAPTTTPMTSPPDAALAADAGVDAMTIVPDAAVVERKQQAPKPPRVKPTPTPKRAVSCDPPYTLDAGGKRIYKPECL
jgi:eukaryotic-like serine/threonine-protein kinase